jgi:Zn-dependent protease/predicted transcriptional regulator
VRFLRSHVKLGRIGGIEIGLHYSWFIVAILIALSLTANFHHIRPDWNTGVVWTAALITAVLFFVTLLLHELAHSLVAKSRGLPVRAITLFALGGVSQIESEATDAKSEFWIAIVGPLTSFGIGAVCILLARWSSVSFGADAEYPVNTVLLWLGYINIGLAVFNMIPGYPLDGGRVLRAIIWWISGNAEQSTRASAWVGQVVAFLMILLGLFRFFVGANFGGLWLAFLGWFLMDAARSSYVQVGLLTALRDRRVAEMMERDCIRVPGYLSLRDFVDQYLLHSGTGCFVVTLDGQIAGLITPNDVKRVNHEDWTRMSVQSVMRPVDQLRAVPPDMPAVKALEMMSRENLNPLLVVSEGKLQGIFSRSQVARFLQIHSGLEPASRDLAA